MLDSIFQALSEPNRRHILFLLRDGEKSAGEIASHFPISRPAVSQHLKVLQESGLVTVRRQGTRRLYQTNPEGLVQLQSFLDQLWHHRLTRLKAEAEREKRSE